MKVRNKGFTLIEVLLALMLLSVVAVCLTGVLAEQYKMLKFSANVTKETFSTVKRTEQEIQLIRDSVQEDIAVDAGRYTGVEISLFGTADAKFRRKVPAYKIENGVKMYKDDVDGIITPTDDNNAVNKIISFVAADKRQEFEGLYMNEPVTITYTPGAGMPNTRVAQVGRAHGERIEGKHGEITPYDRVLQVNYQWYISREGFYKLYDENEGEAIGVYQPAFPADYKILTGETSINLSRLKEEYRGRHLILVVQAFTTDGVRGLIKTSNPIYVSGLPRDVNSGIEYYHFDASLYNLEQNSIEIRSDGKKYLKAWQQIYDAPQPYYALPGMISEMPQIITEQTNTVEITYGSGASSEIVDKPVYIDYLKFDGTNKLSIQNGNGIDISNTLSYFLVCRIPDISNYRYTPFAVIDRGERIGFSSNGGVGVISTGAPSPLNATDYSFFKPDEWMIVEVFVDTPFVGTLDTYVKVNKEEVVRSNARLNIILYKLIFGQVFNGTALEYAEVDLAECIATTGIVDTITYNGIYDYLSEKYDIDLN